MRTNFLPNRRRLFHSHPRLMTALLLGFVVGAASPTAFGTPLRALIGWNAAVWAYLMLVTWLMLHSDSRRMHSLARQEDNNAVFVLVVMSIGAILSLAAIVIELASARSVPASSRLPHYLLTGTTVFGSWLLVAVIYTFHYAHMFYRAAPGEKPLHFPDDLADPGYWDFLYFSFTIAVAAQTSDISVITTQMRKAVLAQSVLAFIFNAAIIGLTINIAASVVGS
ncbi:MAG TPA: DUF1345 domain-containing protein [Noviherbaspirillum sp.]|uniref:DUF1345 domain-containing protein n=1 Tax=Noviherbaspirillum sp. TaxID=1926288 RepID=UPI002B486B59|nr:DUF1345 domain-containing protein [Noviherbaspirillum sp.]HJV84700.1 DUF1345 domain-containing protein [Noviherbaspirillum sp.]